MKGEILALVCLVLVQSTLLDASAVEENKLNSNKIPICNSPRRYVMIGTERVPCEPPVPGYLPECARCSSAHQCRQPKCWGGKCTDGSTSSLQRCFKAECDYCRLSTECSTKKCWNGKCVKDTTASKHKCFPHLAKPECHSCVSGAECKVGKCWNRKCTDGSYASLLRCGYYRECHSCNSGHQCATRKCWGKKCVFNTRASMDKCFPHHPDPCFLLRQTVTDPEDVAMLRRICK